jgi:hypothetical protein
MLSEKHRAFFLMKTEDAWRRDRGRDGDPWGVWIREYGPVPAGLQDICELGVTLPVRAWFLDDRGLRRADPWGYVRLVLVHGGHLWHTGAWPPRSDSVEGSAARYLPTGHVAIAAYADGTGVYWDCIWGGLFGRGYRYDVNAQGELCGRNDLWVS